MEQIVRYEPTLSDRHATEPSGGGLFGVDCNVDELVLANPSPRPYTIDLRQLFPGITFRRLKGRLCRIP